MKSYSVLFVLVLGLLFSGCSTNGDSPVIEEPATEPTNTPLPPSPTPIVIESGQEAGDVREDLFGVKQVWVPAGTFMRGSTEEELASFEAPSWAGREMESEQPQHKVTISKGYWIDMHEVTNAQFQAFVDDGAYFNDELWSEDGLAWLETMMRDKMPKICRDWDKYGPNHPKVCITWFEAEAFANWRGGRLPTEAEWEFAARGPESSIFPWGNAWDETKANVVRSTGLTEVGSYPDGASWVGALDMSGNAMEWVNDWLGWSYYELEEETDPQGPENGMIKIEKGGWWGAPFYVARSAYHHFEDPPTYQDYHIGFRLVIDPTE